MFQSNLNKLNPSQKKTKTTNNHNPKKKLNKLKERNFHFFLTGCLNHRAAHIQTGSTLQITALFVKQQGVLEQSAAVSCLAASTAIAF